jgi:hypothetical protein
VNEARGQFRITEEGECPPLEDVIRRLVKTLTENGGVYTTVIYKVQPLVVSKGTINPITNASPFYMSV